MIQQQIQDKMMEDEASVFSYNKTHSQQGANRSITSSAYGNSASSKQKYNILAQPNLDQVSVKSDMNKDFLQFNDNKQINLNKYDFDGRSSE